MVLGAKLCGSSNNGGNTTTTTSTSSNSTSGSSSKEGNWAMGFLLVFFHPDGDPPNNYHNNQNQSANPLRKRSSSFSLSSPLKSPTTNAALLAKTQSTLSICGLLVFTTLLLFTLSTFEPTSITTTAAAAASADNYRSSSSSPRRVLHQIPRSGIFRKGTDQRDANFSTHIAPALQGMGVLYRKGSKGMTDLVVGHVAEGATEIEVATFTRLIHHSGLLSRADLVFVFESPGSAARLGPVVRAESEDFMKVVWLCKEVNSSCVGRGSGFGLARYMREVGEEGKEAVWGRRSGGNWSESTRASYGSVVGFDSSELDPEGSLSGFLDHVPMSLRRWACYPMLLGRVRRHFKHVMLADVRGALVLSDPFARVRNKSTESVLVWPDSDPEPARGHGHSRRTRAPAEGQLNPGVVVGGGRGVRRFAAAALTEIVRSVVERKGGKQGRNSVTESGLVNQLVHNGHLLKNINVITSAESIPDASSLAGFNSLDSSSSSSFLAFSEYFSVVQRSSNSNSGKNVDIDTIIRKEICSSHELYSSVYRDCLASNQ